MKRLLLLALAALSPIVGASAQTASLTASSSNYSSAGGTITLTAEINYTTVAFPTALSFNITLPPGWAVQSKSDGSGLANIGGTNLPPVSPIGGQTGNVGFAYGTSGFPANRASFAVVVTYPAGLTGTQTIAASALYRTPETTLPVPSLNFTPAADSAPAITTHPISQTVVGGQRVTLIAAASGNPAPTFQWRRNGEGGDITNAIGPTYTIPFVTSASAGSYDVVVTNPSGATATSNAAVLTVASVISGFTPATGGQGVLVTINGTNLAGAKEVRFNGLKATTMTAVSATQVTAIVPTFATTGPISVVRSDDTVVTSGTSFTVTQDPRLSVVSRMGPVTGTTSIVVGTFTVEGSVAKKMLIRGVGPAFGSDPANLSDPFVALVDSAGTVVASNNEWGTPTNGVTATEVQDAMTAVGASPAYSSTSSKDAALLVTLNPGTYSARVTGFGGTAGTAALQIFDVQDAPRLTYVANVGMMPAGEESVSTTFTLTLPTGVGSKAVLIRALGAGSLGITGSIANPTMFVTNTGSLVASNDNWGTNTNLTDIATATALVGAMPLGANDSAVLVTLAAGTYTITVGKVGSPAGGPVGTEIFVVDSFRSGQVAPALIATIPGQTAPFGGTVTFSAPYVGKAPVAFQWKKDGVDIATATNQLLTLSGASLGAVGSASAYSVVVSNGITPNAVSHGATLTVTKADQSISFAALDPRTFGSGNFNLTATATSTLGVAFASSNSAVATVSGNVVTITGVGTTTITASQAGDTNYNAAPSVPQTLTITKGTAGVTLGGLAATFDFGPKPVTATTVPAGLTVNVTYNGGTTPPNQAGSYAIVATVDDVNYQGSATGTLVIAKANQTITFGTLETKTFGDAPFALGATTTSPHTVLYASSNPAVATVSGNTVTIVGAGSTIITASEPGGTNFNAATPVNQTLTVNKATASVVLSNLSATYDGTPKPAAVATTPSGLQVNFTYNGSSTVPTDAGSYAVIGTVNEANYQGSGTGTLVIAKATQTIAFGPLLSKPFNDPNFPLMAVSLNSASQPTGLTISYVSSDPNIAEIVNGNQVDLKNKGSTVITASQGGSNNYLAATPVPQTLDVLNAGQAITFAALPTKTFGDAPMMLTAESRATLDNAVTGLTVAFASSNTTVATISGNTLTIVGGGTSIITATQAGNDNFAAATPVPQTLTVNKAAGTVVLGSLAQSYTGTARTATSTTTPAGLTVDFTYDPGVTAPINVGTYAVVGTINSQNYSGTANGTLVISKADQTITFAGTELVGKTFGDAPFTLAASADSTLAVSFASSDPSVATVSGNTITILTGGTTTITATQAGNGNFNAAPPVARTLAIAKAAATVVVTDLTHTYNGAPKGAGGTTTPVGLALSFSYTTGPAGTAPINAGSYGVTATIVDPRYQGFATGTITINKADQVIDFAALPSKPFNDPNFALTAVSRRVGDNQPTGLTISYSSSDTTKAEIVSGNMVDLKQQGSTTITASQTGDSNYNAATSVTQALVVEAAGQTITFAGTELAGKTFGNGPITLVAESRANLDSSLTGLTVSFTSDNPAVATISANTLTIVGAGTANITASQAGNPGFFAAATPVVRTLTVAKAAATVNLGNLAQTYDNTPRAATAVTNPPGLNVAFTYTPTGGTASPTAPTAAGSYAVTATITGATPPESNYVGSATGTLVISKATQTITFANILSPKFVNAGSFSLTATSDATPTLPVTFTSSNPSVASIVGNVVTIHTLGTTTITAKQAGDTNYLPAVDVAQTLEVRPVAPVITAHPPLAQTIVVGDTFSFGPVTMNAFSSPVTFTLSGTLPAGLTASSVNSTTGAINGIVTATPGVYPFTLTATNATAPADSRTIVLTVNPPAPVFTSPASVSGTVAASFTYTAVATHAASYTLTGALPAGLGFANGVISGTPGNSSAGTYPVTITATNVTGSASLSLVLRIFANPNSPVITSASLVNGQVNAVLNYQLVASIPAGSGGGTIAYAVVGALPSGVTLNPTSGVVSGTPAVGSAGSYPVHFVATNTNGTGLPLQVTFVIAPAQGVPVVTSNGSASASLGQSFTYNITASNGPITGYAATGLPPGLTLDTASGAITGTPTAETPAGSPTVVTLTATNATGTSAAKPLLISVGVAPGTPVITSALSANARVGLAFTYTISASATPTSYTATGLPPGLSLTGAVISGTPTQADSFEVTLRAINAVGTGAAATLVLNIVPAATAPTITSPAGASGTVGASFNYAIVATPAPIAVYAVTGTLPLGLSLNATSGVISGTPSAHGISTVDITAGGPGGTSLPQPLVINIAPSASVPGITSPGTASGRVGEAFTYMITATNVGTAPYAPSVVLEAINLPPGLAGNPSTGVIQGTPTTVGVTTASLVGTNANGTGASRALTITIDPAATAPVIVGSNLAFAQVGAPFTYAITVSPAAAATRFEAIGAPAWLSLNTSTGALTGTPTAGGMIPVQLIAFNSAGAGSPFPLVLNVAAAAGSPVVTSARTATGTVGALFGGYTIVASGTGGAVTSYVAVGLPPGLTLNPATGAVTGTPTSSGTYLVNVSANNAAGAGAAVVVTFTIARSVTFGL